MEAEVAVGNNFGCPAAVHVEKLKVLCDWVQERKWKVENGK